MLAHVADEQHPVLRSKALPQGVHLFRARQTRFVEDVQVLLIRACCSGVAARQVPLQRARFDPGLGERVRRTRRRREAFDLVPLTFGGIAHCDERRRLARAGGALECRDLVAAPENLLDRRALAVIQVLLIVGDGLARGFGPELCVAALTGPHPVNCSQLELHHRWRGEGPPWRARVVLAGEKFAAFDATIDLRLEVLDSRLAKRTLQCVA